MARLKVKQISDFVSQVAAQPVGTATATAIAGVQSDVDANAIAIAKNTAKATNVTTNLAVTESTTTNIVTSSDGTDATLTAATTLKAGLMTKAMFDEHVANNGKVGITTDQADAIVANTTAISTVDGRVTTLLEGSTEALDTFGEIKGFIDSLNEADVTVVAAISTAVSNDVVHAGGIKANADAIAGIVTEVDLSLESDGTSNTVVNSKGTDAKLLGATEEKAGLMTANDFRKLSGIQDGADVTDATSVAEAGALMAEDIANLAQVKAFDKTNYADADQGALADTAVQDLSDLLITATAAELNQLASKTLGDIVTYNYTSVTTDISNAISTEVTNRNTAITTAINTLDLDLQAQIDDLVGAKSDEVVALWVSKTSFRVEAPFELKVGHVAVFVNGLQIHEAAEGIDGWRSANGLDFTVEGLGYDLEADDHIIVSGTLAPIA